MEESRGGKHLSGSKNHWLLQWRLRKAVLALFFPLLLSHSFKMLYLRKPAKSAYLVSQGYANFPKTAWMGIISDMYRCHPHHFLEICKPLVNKGIRSYQIKHLNMAWHKKVTGSFFPIREFQFSRFVHCDFHVMRCYMVLSGILMEYMVEYWSSGGMSPPPHFDLLQKSMRVDANDHLCPAWWNAF